MINDKMLKGKIIRSGLSQADTAAMIGISATSFNYKLNNKVEFVASEIQRLIGALSLTASDVNEIFFSAK